MSYSNSTSAASENKPEGGITSRIRQMADSSQSMEGRLGALLRILRGVPPPSVIAGNGVEKLRQDSIEDQITRHEQSQNAISVMLGEMETLL